MASRRRILVHIAACAALVQGCGQRRSPRPRRQERPERPEAHRRQGSRLPVVRFVTTQGSFSLVLFPDRAPRTVRAFLDHVRRGRYDGTIFHRVLPGILVQCGGYDTRLRPRRWKTRIFSEADNGLRNLKGTVALARYDWDPHSARGEFYVNLRDNPQFDRRGPEPEARGYTVFGRVLEGMELLERISRLPTCPRPPFWNLPCRPPTILRAEFAGQAASSRSILRTPDSP